MPASCVARRALLRAAPLPWLGLLSSCATPLPLDEAPRPTDAAARRLADCAAAHGGAAFASISDVAVAYDGRWRPVIGRLQPEIVDAGYRVRSEERLLPARGVVAQSFVGPAGHKQVFWRRGDGGGRDPGEVAVWYDGVRDSREATLAASALVAEGYGLFLLGPLWVAGRGLPVQLDGTDTVRGRSCDVVSVWMRPGLGRVAQDRVAFYVDRDDATMRRVRFTLEGFAGTRGAVAEVDVLEYRRIAGVLWPVRLYEELVRPFRLPVHDWWVTGLDVNRGLGEDALRIPAFAGAAARPAAPLPGAPAAASAVGGAGRTARG